MNLYSLLRMVRKSYSLCGKGEKLSPLTTTPCPELRPLKNQTWSFLKRSRPLLPPAPLEPPLLHISGCILGGKEKEFIVILFIAH